MSSPQTAPKHHDSGISAPSIAIIDHISHKWNQLIRNIVQPLFVSADPPVRISLGIRPGLLIDGVDGKYHDFPRLDPRRPGICHVEIFKIVKPSILTGNKKHRPALVTIYFTLHVTPKSRAVAFVIIHFHTIILPFHAMQVHSAAFWA